MLRELNSSVATSRGRARARRQRWIRTTSISILVMVVLFGGVGLAYVWYIDNSRPVTPVAMPTPTTDKLAQPASATATPEGPVGVSVQVLSSPVKPGGNASLTIRTRPNAACSIRVTYKEQPSTDSGLIPKTADAYGLVQWTWTVEMGRPVGTWPVEVTCALGKQSGYVKGDLQIANS